VRFACGRLDLPDFEFHPILTVFRDHQNFAIEIEQPVKAMVRRCHEARLSLSDNLVKRNDNFLGSD
jgi:hypothetical protein